MTLKTLFGASACAALLAACATTEPAYDVDTATVTTTTTATSNTSVLSDAQQIGVADNDGYAATGSVSKLDDKFRVDCGDNDQFVASGCRSVDATTVTTTTEYVTLTPNLNVVDLIASSPDHERLRNAIVAAGLEDDLREMDNFTIFAPTDEAFSNASLTGLSDDQDLIMLLKNHIVDGRYLALDVVDAIPASGTYNIPTLGDRTVDVYRSGGGFKILGAGGYLIPVTAADMYGTNGVVHVIDTVLVPDYDSPDIEDAM